MEGMLQRCNVRQQIIPIYFSWVFGGMHAECSNQLDDTWRYSIEEGLWSELIASRTWESCLRRNEDCECLCL